MQHTTGALNRRITHAQYHRIRKGLVVALDELARASDVSVSRYGANKIEVWEDRHAPSVAYRGITGPDR